jgi:hypothetical protein
MVLLAGSVVILSPLYLGYKVEPSTPLAYVEARLLFVNRVINPRSTCKWNSAAEVSFWF